MLPCGWCTKQTACPPTWPTSMYLLRVMNLLLLRVILTHTHTHTQQKDNQCLHLFISVKTRQRRTQGWIDFLSPAPSFNHVHNSSVTLHAPTLSCVCVFSIFSYWGADVLGYAGEEILDHCKAGNWKKSCSTEWSFFLWICGKSSRVITSVANYETLHVMHMFIIQTRKLSETF